MVPITVSQSRTSAFGVYFWYVTCCYCLNFVLTTADPHFYLIGRTCLQLHNETSPPPQNWGWVLSSAPRNTRWCSDQTQGLLTTTIWPSHISLSICTNATRLQTSDYPQVPGLCPPPEVTRNQPFQDVPSSDPFDPEENPILYPRIQDWLVSLDMGERGADNQNWQQYTDPLARNGFTHLIQIADEGRNDNGAASLMGICNGMPIGTARLLVKYAITDCSKITKDEKKCHQARRG